MSVRIKAIIGIALLALMALVAIQNSGPVAIRFLVWRADIDGLFLYLVIFAMGCLAGALGVLALRRRRPKS